MDDGEDSNVLLSAAGYDGITHIGGGVTGGRPHRVWIAFRPNQIKSASGNKGTFNPDSARIGESVATEAGPDCGANAPGGGGFQEGNDCAAGDGSSADGSSSSGSSGSSSKPQKGLLQRIRSWLLPTHADKRETRIKESRWLSGKHLQHRVKQRMVQALDGAGLTPAQKAQYRAALDAVVPRMSDVALRRFDANVDEIGFKSSAVEVTHDLHDGQVRREILRMSGKLTMGFYERHKDSHAGRLVLDGDPPPEFGVKGITRDVYAHEFSHALDYEPNTRNRISDTPEWQQAWKSELKGDKLTKQAAVSPVEGFAEFGRLAMFAPEHAKNLFPKSWSVWKKHGLGR